ncbi:hypothetical protein L486_03622 [Kwoniella mangroviensis CBS 10435]|uniref:Pheromone a factor receptor n=1 Tax=Kwoniella mangroviensis CBS 10435 TaxID=1331196 RepID=A0A1B9IUA2_9TREE|nr:hypothetical protein L486_03622 [Kwoniella mangroviensis CBS 10435]OCF76622.1 hypothetical protein I204_02320 [Kwoniella mangroviensis CBS 8886]
MRHPDYPFWSFISTVLVLLPLPWHIRARNIATLSLIFWLVLANVVTFVNTIVWAGNFRDHNPIWCDISSRVLLLIVYALPACSLAQMRRLESVASTRRSIISSRDRKRRIIEEITICLVLPCLFAALYHIVQGHRYDIVENIGCVTPIYMSIPAVIIRFVVPGTIAVASIVFAVLAVRWFLIRRLQFQTILAASDSSLSVGRYLRLIALAVTDSTVLLAYAIYNAISWTAPLMPYKSWTAVHLNFSQYAQYPEELFGSDYSAFVANVYAPFLYSIIFFTFFGFGEEAIAEYLAAAAYMRGLFGKIGFGKSQQPNLFDEQQFTLGSKVVPAGGDTLSFGGADDVALQRDHEKSVHCDTPEFHASSSRGGVAVTVERSIV